ncbi:unnamed protein product [Cylicostephanus goldi]|uniref:RRM domain-containing protein n=1 Tax=Cylicostephanus goldi TaxID=71465 RepID=A0A3P6QHM3_CYLGO|nr:unnamed protein product [Cylicostephanus goldi]
MTWASSRRLVITNDVPQIVVANSTSRCHDRGGTVFTSYSSRGASSPNARGGFQAGRGGCSTGYQIRNSSTPRGGASYYAWRSNSNIVTSSRGGAVPVTTYYRGGSAYQTRTPNFYPRSSSLSTVVNLPGVSSRPAQNDPTVTAPKFFPMSLNATPQFVDNVGIPLQYPLPMRRVSHQLQPLSPRRDIRLQTPQAIMVSKKAPIGVDVSCGGSSAHASGRSGGDASGDTSRAVQVKEEQNASESSEANRGDAEENEDDGGDSPDVLRNNEDTWDFWDRRDSPMAELLHSDKLCKAQLIFLNVPRLAYGQQHVVRSLIHREINSNLPILDIHITYRKWTVRFYRSEDAVQVLRHFNGFSFRNHKLLVRACQNNAAFGDVASLEEAAQMENEERRALPDVSSDSRTEHDAIWTLAEWKDILEFKK